VPYTELLVGAGNSREKRVGLSDDLTFKNLVTLDMSPDCKPDVIHDLNELPLPFKKNSFDEIHAYEVLEHVGKQGDWRFFFNQFDEFARILKPRGLFIATSPPSTSPWIWGDPGHTRYMGPEVYTFLLREQYDIQIGKTSMTDYRRYFSSNWELAGRQLDDIAFIVVLRNLK